MKTNEGKEMKKFIEVQTLISKELKKIKDKKGTKPEGGDQYAQPLKEDQKHQQHKFKEEEDEEVERKSFKKRDFEG